MTTPQREYHYEEHFSDEPHGKLATMMSSNAYVYVLIIYFIASGSNLSGGAAGQEFNHALRSPSKSPSKIRIKGSGPSKFIKPSHEKQNIFWHSSQDSVPPPNFSPGISNDFSR